MLNTEVVRGFDEKALRDITAIISGSFPAGWGAPDAKRYYRGMLESEKSIHVFLTDGGSRAGYLHAMPQYDAYDELKGDDPGMPGGKGMYYVEMLCILPASRGKKGLSLMLDKLEAECRARGIGGISFHARVTNGLSGFIRRRYKNTAARRIEKWRYYNYEEPADYIEAVLP